MAVTNTPVFLQNPKHYSVQLTTGSGSSTAVTVATGGTNGTKITSVILSNSDSTANNCRIGIVSSGGTFLVMGFSSVAIGAGYLSSTGNPAVNLFAIPGLPIDNDGQTYALLNSSLETLAVALTAVISSAGAFMNINAFGADF